MKTIISVFIAFVMSFSSLTAMLDYVGEKATAAKDSISENIQVFSYLQTNRPRYAQLNLGSFDDVGNVEYAALNEVNVSPQPVQTITFSIDEVQGFEMYYGRQDLLAISGGQADMIYINSFAELPLLRQDYYWGKYENGAAGARGLNNMPTLLPGNGVGVIADRYIDVKSYNGFIQPQRGYYFGSGLCWSTSALGYIMDQANADFQAKYGMPLFTFRRGDRAPHSHYYKTYQPSNRGYGYTVLQQSSGVPVQDYRFTINPAIKNNPELSGLKIKIVMLSTTSHPSAYSGQSIGGYILSNKDF